MRNPTMKQQLKVLVVTFAIGPLAYWGPGLLKTVSELEVFAVRNVEVTGIKVLTEDAVLERLALGSFASVWGDADVWRERIASDPMVRTVEIRRRVPSGLLVRVEERAPVALAGTPMLEPVDAEGYRLPIDPTLYRLDLPIISSGRAVPEGAALFPAEVRSLAAEVEHLLATHQDFAHRISTIRWYSDGVVAVRLQSPDVDFIMPVHTTGARIREGESALGHAMQEGAGRSPAEVDLRFAEQVVIRGAAGSSSASTFSAGGR
ncbi:MAG: cell division protein FtsQ/DivIB [Longimicrobiales bacterium]